MNVLYLDALWPLKGHLSSVFSSGSPQSLSLTQPASDLCLPSFLPTCYSPVLAPSWEVSTTFHFGLGPLLGLAGGREHACTQPLCCRLQVPVISLQFLD